MTTMRTATVEYDADRGALLIPLYDKSGDNGEFFGALASAFLGHSSTTLKVTVEVQERGSDGGTIVHRAESDGPWWTTPGD